MRFKKQIAMICLFTFLFLPFSAKYEEPNADVLVLTTGTIIACAALATACGVVITHPDMLHDVGERVYNGIKSIPGAIEQFGDNVRINVTKDLISTVVSLCNNFPVTDFIKNIINKHTSDYDVMGNFDILENLSLQNQGSVGQCYVKSALNGVTFNLYYGNHYSSHVLANLSNSEYKLFTWNTTDATGIFSFDGQSFSYRYNDSPLDSGYNSAISSNSLSLRISASRGRIYIKDFENVQSVCIPYTPENTKDVSNDKVQEFFPLYSGSISAPIDKPLSDYNVSVDKPIFKPTDLVSEGDIIADKSDTGVLDKPNTDVVDSPVTGNNLWDSLMEFLKKLFAPLLALLGWIGDILMSILDFLKGLLDALIEALSKLFEYLFVPTLDPSSLILIPDDSGLGQLIQLFDWGDLLDITPKPYIFETNMNINSLVDNEATVWNLRFDLFGNETIEKYMPYVRNILSYTCLIGVMYFVIIHFLPKRDID